jgi:hypothetical protein
VIESPQAKRKGTPPRQVPRCTAEEPRDLRSTRGGSAHRTPALGEARPAQKEVVANQADKRTADSRTATG